ncbi:MAG: hypothetical protein WCK64_06985 [Synechococcaceae cyanobacterium ELA445]|jgi:hypothetical protein
MSKILLLLLIVGGVLGLHKGILKIDWSVLAKDVGLPFTVGPLKLITPVCPGPKEGAGGRP